MILPQNHVCQQNDQSQKKDDKKVCWTWNDFYDCWGQANHRFVIKRWRIANSHQRGAIFGA
jgi:hypothetical protein